MTQEEHKHRHHVWKPRTVTLNTKIALWHDSVCKCGHVIGSRFKGWTDPAAPPRISE